MIIITIFFGPQLTNMYFFFLCYDKRSTPKKVNAMTATKDNKILAVGDRFGDVYTYV